MVEAILTSCWVIALIKFKKRNGTYSDKTGRSYRILKASIKNNLCLVMTVE